jgi:predicted ABC-type ATPase
MLERINTLLESKENFAFETTLASKSYKSKIFLAKEKGYNVTLLFFFLRNENLAIERVKTRVLEGGHHIETEVIKRRYKNGIKNLFEIYLPIADEVMIFDNSEGKHELIAEKIIDSEINVLNELKFNQLKKHYFENL